MSDRPDLVILGCVATKRDEPAPARNLYISPLWERRRAYAEASGARWFIFSALYGMVEPDRVIEPYDVAPMLVILPEAGGAFTDFGGERRADGGNALATNGRLHDEVRELVRR